MGTQASYEELVRDLELTKAKLQAVFELIPAHIHIVDPEFNVLDVCAIPALLHKLGLKSSSEILGRKCYEVFKSRTTTCPECIVEKCLSTGIRETRGSTAEEDEALGLSTKLYAAPIHDRQGRIVATIELAMDVTDLKKAEENLIVLNATLDQLARHDELTGLYNRRALNDRLATEMAITQRAFRPLSLLMLDIDHFKQINDKFGHLAGDDTLRCLGTILQKFVRAGDQASRYGGEEFCILLPDTTATQAVQTAERLRVQIAETDCQPCQVYVSIGVATLSPQEDSMPLSPNEFIHWADQALYTAKRQGRNQVVIARNTA